MALCAFRGSKSAAGAFFLANSGGLHTRLADAPLAADQAGFEELGGLLYMVGGRGPVNHSDKTYAYNPATDTWDEKADLPIEAQSGVLKAVGGKLYFIGGYNSQTGIFYDTVYEYDPSANTWTQKTSMPTAREDFGAAVYDGKIFCFGGLFLDGEGVAVLPTTMEVYDPATDTWDETLADLPDAKLLGDFGVAYNGKIYAIGATNIFVDYPDLTPTGDVYEYDPVGDAWSAKASMPLPRCYKEAVALGTKIYVVSGATDTTTVYTNTIYEYDPALDSWSESVHAPYAARGAGLAVYNGSIYMLGGFNGQMLPHLFRLDIP